MRTVEEVTEELKRLGFTCLVDSNERDMFTFKKNEVRRGSITFYHKPQEFVYTHAFEYVENRGFNHWNPDGRWIPCTCDNEIDIPSLILLYKDL